MSVYFVECPCPCGVRFPVDSETMRKGEPADDRCRDLSCPCNLPDSEPVMTYILRGPEPEDAA